MIRFDDLSLHPALLKVVQDAGFAAPTAIQAQAIPPILAGRDVLGCAQTGTGKTAAFVLPLVQRLAALVEPPRRTRAIRGLILSPTRELATQIAQVVSDFGAGLGIENAVIFGGVSDVPQRRALRRGVDVVVATPGRLEDLMRAREVDLRSVEIVVLDEADRMLDAGFLVAVRRILNATPRERQTLLFSATMPPEIRTLADSVQRDAAWVAVSPVATPPAQVEQAVLFVERPDKRRLLEHLLADPAVTRALVFTRTKRGADRVAKHLSAAVERVEAIHGDRSQAQRERALASFRRGTTRVLVATDLAARGIDVEGISHVINFELPDDSESYVHRIGRTGRVAAQGVALSLCDTHERDQLARIERLMKKAIPVRREHPFTTPSAAVKGANSHRRDRSHRRSPNREHRWA
ncbi:MAG TPA: DEAD/DEAH box helicase [Myxococcota bacterium]|nr:DEAD/DEAH box helicase [Myxococcota bacterium]